MELLAIALQQAPNKAGIRKTRFIITRATFPELKSTTIKTATDWIPPSIFPLRMNESPIVGTLTLPMPDGTLVLSEWLFIALDKPKDLGKLLSLEATAAFINECKEVDQAVLDTLTSRVGRYPSVRDGGPTWSGVIMDTNPPAEDHWYAELMKKPPDNWRFFVQPPALLRDSTAERGYIANPKAENIENLPGGHQYYFNALGGKDNNWIKAYILGEFAAVRDGKPVFGDTFNERVHVSERKLWPVAGKPVIIGLDFGLTPAATIGQIVDGQLRILDELCATRMGLTDFINTLLTPLIAEKYSKNKRLYVGDPSGARAMDTDERSCFQVMHAMKMYVEPASTNAIEPRLESVRHFLTRLVDGGKPAFMIDPRCAVLRNGFVNGYQYDRVQVSGEARYRETPSKNHYSHVHDSLQYLCLRALTAMRREQSPNYSYRALQVADTTTGY